MMPAPTRPSTSSAATTASAMTGQRRQRSGMFTLRRDALRAQPLFHLAANRRETLGRASLEAKHEHRLRVGRPYQPPPIAEEHACAVHVDHVVRLPEVRDRILN